MRKFIALVCLLVCGILCGCGKGSYEDTLLLGHQWGEKPEEFYEEIGDNYRVSKGGELFGCDVNGVDAKFGDTKGMYSMWYSITLANEEDVEKLIADMFELMADAEILQHDEYATQEFVEWNTHNGPGGVTVKKMKSGSLWEIQIACWYYAYSS